ncbi:hypothetical protein EV2_017815 [Malus domestica]
MGRHGLQQRRVFYVFSILPCPVATSRSSCFGRIGKWGGRFLCILGMSFVPPIQRKASSRELSQEGDSIPRTSCLSHLD